MPQIEAPVGCHGKPVARADVPAVSPEKIIISPTVPGMVLSLMHDGIFSYSLGHVEHIRKNYGIGVHVNVPVVLLATLENLEFFICDREIGEPAFIDDLEVRADLSRI